MLHPQHPRSEQLNATETLLWDLITQCSTSEHRAQLQVEILSLLNTPLFNHPVDSLLASLAHSNTAANNRTFLLHAITHDERVALLIINKLGEFGLVKSLWQADNDGYTPLFEATRCLKPQLMTALLSVYAEHYPSDAPNPINQRCGPDGTTPLMIAAELGFSEGITLLERGYIRKCEEGEGEWMRADETIRDSNGNTLLHYLVRGPLISLAKRFLDRYPVLLDSDNDDGLTPVCMAIDHNQDGQLIMLAERGAELGIHRDDNNLLHVACIKSNKAIIAWLLKHGFSPNIANQTTRLLPLDIAVANANADSIVPLLEHGAGLFYNFFREDSRLAHKSSKSIGCK
jgi:ankyrin repeat protein